MVEDNRPFEPFATRSMIRTMPDGRESPALVEFEVPRPMLPEEGQPRPPWGCRWRLGGFPFEGPMTAYGEDAVQAIFLAQVMAGALVAANPGEGVLDWASVPNFGFPTLPGS